jgi:hypothetical protein
MNCKNLADGEPVQTEFAWAEAPHTESANAESTLAESAAVEAARDSPRSRNPQHPRCPVRSPTRPLPRPTPPRPLPQFPTLCRKSARLRAPPRCQSCQCSEVHRSPYSRRQAPLLSKRHAPRHSLPSPPPPRRGTRSLFRIHRALRRFPRTRRANGN